jgi:hypothetical protein
MECYEVGNGCSFLHMDLGWGADDEIQLRSLSHAMQMIGSNDGTHSAVQCYEYPIRIGG